MSAIQYYAKPGTEIIEKENHIFYVEDDILFTYAYGDVDERIAMEVKRIVFELLKDRGPTNTYIDVNNSGKSTPEARRIWKELSEHEKTGKVAFVGMHIVARVIAGFIMKVSGNRKLRFFSNKEDALTWLKNPES